MASPDTLEGLANKMAELYCLVKEENPQRVSLPTVTVEERDIIVVAMRFAAAWLRLKNDQS